MEIISSIKVGNNSELGFDRVGISTTCHGFVTLKMPKLVGGLQFVEVELSRDELLEFLVRTCPQIALGKVIVADPIPSSGK